LCIVPHMQSVDELAKLLRSCGLTDYSQHLLSMPRPKCVRAVDVCFSPSFSVGASDIDDVLGGGMYPGLLYEIVGPGGSGKTQFGLQCLLQSLTSSPAPAISAYICTEKSVPMMRLRALSSAFASRHSLNFDPLDRIFVHTAHSFRELEGIVLTQLPALSSRPQIPNCPIARVGCVVIDSVCGFSRDLDEQWLGADAAQMRATALGRMAQVGLRVVIHVASFMTTPCLQALKALASSQQCVIVSVNQVSVRMRDCSTQSPLAADDCGGLHISSNQCLSPEVFSASISFSPAEFPSMSVSAAAAGSFCFACFVND
jgi:RecA/RadA recombinase